MPNYDTYASFHTDLELGKGRTHPDFNGIPSLPRNEHLPRTLPGECCRCDTKGDKSNPLRVYLSFIDPTYICDKCFEKGKLAGIFGLGRLVNP